MFKYLEEEKRLEKARKIFLHAKKNSKFYEEKYKNIDEIENYKDWVKVPFLTRTELFNNSYPKTRSMLTYPIKKMLITSTGGSSGIARYGVMTYQEYEEFVNVQAKAMKLLGIKEDDIVANLFVAGNLWPTFFSVADVLKKIGAVHLPISSNIDVDQIIKYILEFKPNVLLSLPTVLIFLADKFLSENLDGNFIKFLGYAGEHLSKSAQEYLKKAFKNAKTFALAYSSADCGLMGYQCNKCKSNEYHVPTDFQFVEIYDFEREKICGKGETGEVIVTNLARFSQPIIRYRIGDLAQWKDSPCSCGDKNPVFILKGRAGADFKIGGEYISMQRVERALSTFVSRDGISANYQLSIEDVGGEREKLKITLTVESSTPDISSKWREKIAENLMKEIEPIKVGVEMDYVYLNVEFVKLGSLERSPITGKIKNLKDKRAGV